MHEWAIAEAVVARAAEVARENGIATVRQIVVRLGELQAIDRDAFEMGLSIVRADAPEVAGATFTLDTESATFACRACGTGWPLRDSMATLPEDEREAIHMLPETVHIYVACPACASPDFAIVEGRGVSLASVSG
jgi:hydrogenase nickel incorporation protein HypA/HybF